MKNTILIEKKLKIKIADHLLSLPTPTSISFLWNLGFIIGITLIVQVVTGLLLSINYIPQTRIAFESVIHIIRDIDSGWIIRYTHINGASLLFILMYTHIARGLYINSPQKQPIVWASGILILLVSIATAFIGYVLPWGQISYWGATVITRIISAIPYIGEELVTWLWGNFAVSQPTLNRFFSLHFILPLIIIIIVVLHLILLHNKGSSNPTGTNPDLDKIKFFPYFMVKDLTPLSLIATVIFLIIRIRPNILGDVENFNRIRNTSTPTHIQPEWYFLFAYAILRAVPSKIGGVLAIVAAILVYITLTIKRNSINKKFSPLKKLTFFSWAATVTLLTWLGANPVEEPFTALSKTVSTAYFALSIII